MIGTANVNIYSDNLRISLKQNAEKSSKKRENNIYTL